LLVTVNNRLKYEIEIVHDLSCHPIDALDEWCMQRIIDMLMSVRGMTQQSPLPLLPRPNIFHCLGK